MFDFLKLGAGLAHPFQRPMPDLNQVQSDIQTLEAASAILDRLIVSDLVRSTDMMDARTALARLRAIAFSIRAMVEDETVNERAREGRREN